MFVWTQLSRQSHILETLFLRTAITYTGVFRQRLPLSACALTCSRPRCLWLRDLPLLRCVSSGDVVKSVTGVRNGRGGILKDMGKFFALWGRGTSTGTSELHPHVFAMSAMFMKVRLLACMLYVCWAANLCSSGNLIPVSSACSIATFNNNPLIKCHPS